ncbi:MAG: DUF1015 domain-containing protein [Clostridia bacterium]|nr:DUF1015 domain-containing protein [Clostridia bacterium]
MDFTLTGIAPCDFLLPATNPAPWACVACDQYTSQPEYWQEADAFVGDAPSTLRLMLPECYLSELETRMPPIRKAMTDYVAQGILTTQVHDGFVLVERTTHAGKRLGLVCAVDLEQYDFSIDSLPPIRPTEETVVARLPAREKIRAGATVELGHIMMLMDDPLRTVIEPLYAKRDELHCLYDFDLMLSGGHLRGWRVDSDEDKAAVLAALLAIREKQGDHPLMFAVGDGNHSLAAAKRCWENIKAGLAENEQRSHPARYAMAEVVNIHDEALTFEPIHRVVTGTSLEDIMADWLRWCEERGMVLADEGEGHHVTVVQNILRKDITVKNPNGALDAQTLQLFLDDYLARHSEAAIDYIHGEDAVLALTGRPDAVGFLLPALDKSRFFDTLADIGVMPRKTFSLGEANEKRYYMECRAITR